MTGDILSTACPVKHAAIHFHIKIRIRLTGIDASEVEFKGQTQLNINGWWENGTNKDKGPWYQESGMIDETSRSRTRFGGRHQVWHPLMMINKDAPKVKQTGWRRTTGEEGIWITGNRMPERSTWSPDRYLIGRGDDFKSSPPHQKTTKKPRRTGLNYNNITIRLAHRQTKFYGTHHNNG